MQKTASNLPGIPHSGNDSRCMSYYSEKDGGKMKGFGEQVFTKLFGLLLPVLPVAGVYYGLAYIILYIPDPVSSFVSFTLGVLVLVIIAYGIVQFVTGRTVLFKLLAEKNGGDDLERVNEHSELYRKIDRYLDDRGQ